MKYTLFSDYLVYNGRRDKIGKVVYQIDEKGKGPRVNSHSKTFAHVVLRIICILEHYGIIPTV